MTFLLSRYSEAQRTVGNMGIHGKHLPFDGVAPGGQRKKVDSKRVVRHLTHFTVADDFALGPLHGDMAEDDLDWFGELDAHFTPWLFHGGAVVGNRNGGIRVRHSVSSRNPQPEHEQHSAKDD